MPLLKRSAFALAEVPSDIKPNETVYQVRFTKEIFRDYKEYLKRINLYRQKVWACKVTGKANLSYEQALMSESKASEQVQQFPKEFVAPVLRMVQFSPLCVSELVDVIHRRFKDHFVENEVLEGVSDGSVQTCRILAILEENESCDSESCSCSYQVAWLKSDLRVICESPETVRSLKRKKHPLTKQLLKSFIRESAFIGVSKKSRWAVHEHLARLHNIPLRPDGEESADGSSDLVEFGNGECSAQSGAKRKGENGSLENGKTKKRKLSEVSGKQLAKYPIEDELLPRPSEDSRPVPCSEFLVPVESVGSLLKVWFFCSSFAAALNISPYSLEDFEEALCYKDDDCSLLKEAHHALLKAVMSNTALNDKLQQLRKKEKKGKRKLQFTLETWVDDLSDTLELNGSEKTKKYATPIRLGEYAELDAGAKLDILSDLTEWSVSSHPVRSLIDQHMPRRKDSKKKQVSADVEDEDDLDEPPALGEHVGGTNGMLKAFKRKKKPVVKKKEKEEVEIEKCPLRNIFLGVDRDHSRYWFFPLEGRVFIESHDSTRWSFYSDKEEFEVFCKSLDLRGVREKGLKEQIDHHYDLISLAFECGSESESDDGGATRRSSRAKSVPSFLLYKNQLR